MCPLQATLFGFSTEAEIRVDRADESQSPSFSWLNAKPFDVLGQDPKVGELCRLSILNRSHNDIHEEHRLQVPSLRVVSKLFAASRDFNELGLERLQFFPVVPRVLPPLRWDG